ncbi:MAG: hypothetical protein SH820_10770 [Xanthomonadales bacterium]|nr:hypothetical protein [Xanthomonadales bacterium]
MLTKSILDTIRDAAGLAAFAPAVPAAEVISGKAANASSYDHHAALVRRNRRMRRAERNAVRSSSGWTVRMW